MQLLAIITNAIKFVEEGTNAMTQSLTVFALYAFRDSAESAADALSKDGIPPQDLAVVLPENIPAANVETKIEPKTPVETSTAATSRGILSGPLGVLAGLSILVIPGLGPLVGEGTLKAGLAGMGVESAVGNFAKYLINLGVPELEAKRYEDRLQQEYILISARVDSPEKAARVNAIFKRTGGEDICTAADRAPDSTAEATPQNERATGAS